LHFCILNTIIKYKIYKNTADCVCEPVRTVMHLQVTVNTHVQCRLSI